MDYVRRLFKRGQPNKIEDNLLAFRDWILGDAMPSMTKDTSNRRFYAAIEELARVIPSPGRDTLTGPIFRGVQTSTMIRPRVPGDTATSPHPYQSWSPDYEIAQYHASRKHGRYGFIFHAQASHNKRGIILRVQDVYDWAQKNADQIPNIRDGLLFALKSQAVEDEVIIREPTAWVSGVEIFDAATGKLVPMKQMGKLLHVPSR